MPPLMLGRVDHFEGPGLIAEVDQPSDVLIYD